MGDGCPDPGSQDRVKYIGKWKTDDGLERSESKVIRRGVR